LKDFDPLSIPFEDSRHIALCLNELNAHFVEETPPKDFEKTFKYAPIFNFAAELCDLINSSHNLVNQRASNVFCCSEREIAKEEYDASNIIMQDLKNYDVNGLAHCLDVINARI
jgi:hypothetical protein